MRKNHFFTIIPGVALFFMFFICDLSAEGQSWVNNSITLKVNRKVAFKCTHEARFREITFSRGLVHNWQGGVVWTTGPRTYLGVFYKRQSCEKEDYILDENRFTLESGWKLSLSKKTAFDLRMRVEAREFRDSLAENHFRFRLRLRITTQVRIGGLRLKPFVATEPFADTLADKINRNRLYLGFGVPLSAHVQWVVNYIRQDTSGKETLHILNTGVDLKF